MKIFCESVNCTNEARFSVEVSNTPGFTHFRVRHLCQEHIDRLCGVYKRRRKKLNE